ncbi:MAG: ABC transporter permease [Bacillota bacterium]
MKQYIISRLLLMIPIILGVSMIVFFIFSLVPGDYVDSLALKNSKYTAEKIDQLKEKFGFDKPIPVRYGKWLKNALKGDLGESFVWQRPVTEVIKVFVKNSFLLAFFAFLLQIIIAIPLGVYSAVHKYSIMDRLFTFFCLIGISIPTIILALFLKKIFCLDLMLLPMSGIQTLGVELAGGALIKDIFLHLLLPGVVLALVQIPVLMRYTRTAMLEVLGEDYIRTALAKGLPKSAIYFKHALRNALIPLVTILGMSVPDLFAGAIIIESIFGIPGVGKVALDAVSQRDFPFLMGFTMFLTVLTLVCNLVTDLLYALVDPRIKGKGEGRI